MSKTRIATVLLLAFAASGCSTGAWFKLPEDTTLVVNERPVEHRQGLVYTRPYSWGASGGIPYAKPSPATGQAIHHPMENKVNHSMISELSRSLLEIVWHFGPKGLNGECCDNLTMPEFIALDKVSSTKDCPVQDIGISLGFTKSGATRVVNRLEKKGYVKKIKSHDDARFCCVDITEKGELVLKSTDSRYLEKIHELVAKMPPQIATEVVPVLLTMAKSLKR